MVIAMKVSSQTEARTKQTVPLSQVHGARVCLLNRIGVEGKKVKAPQASKIEKELKSKTPRASRVTACRQESPAAKGTKVVIVRLRVNEKSSPMLLKVWKGAGARKRSGKVETKTLSTRVVHLLLERRWLGLGEKAQRSSLGRRSLAGAVIEGWGIRVRAVYKDKAKADKALAAALKARTEAEREGGLRDQAQLMVKSYGVHGQEASASSVELGRPACVNGTLTRRIYTVTSSVGETFSNQDLPPGMVEFGGNYFYMSEHDAEDALKSEERRGTPWGYPHNAKKPGDVLKVFSTPVGECGANAYATGLALQDMHVPGCLSLADHDLDKAVSYSKEGLAQVRLQQSLKSSTVRVLLSVREHILQDYRPPTRPPATPLRGARKTTDF